MVNGERNIYYEMYLNKYQHLVDENEYLSNIQKEIIRIILASEVFFVPFAFDGDWDYVYTEGKVVLVSKLLDGKWDVNIMQSVMEDDIYIIEISFQDRRLIADFCCKYCDDQRSMAEGIEIYVPYSDYLKIYKKQLFSLPDQFWRNVIREEDL
ncbi:hypothetical protein DCCM_3750 [Desulfocucumis palustris]|uniref:Uncharacterized protein n=2 Tax=Desulfocucumis palustris TaxID=1898651 RepID=A0A2L2XEP3_9FIRM|nr:hypothetical protein DCCM_3750 [Desulfocucumis palustris]